MRGSKICLTIGAVAIWLVGCSGLNDYHHSSGGGGNNNTGSITVMPAGASLPAFGTMSFAASGSTAVNWQVNGVAGGSQTSGYISSSGTYVAPSAVPTKSDGSGGNQVTTVTITAVSQASSNVFGSTRLTITAPNQNAQSGAVKLGTSGGNINDSHNGFCCGGTLGSLVVRNGTFYILSNNHVLAKRDSGVNGDPINQPGTIDVAEPNTCTTTGTKTVATLADYFNLETGPLPKVDAALGQVTSGQVDTAGNILLLGATQTNGTPDPGAPHAGTGVAATPGQAVAKSGRTTALTCSTVLGTNLTASVGYPRNCGDTTFAFTVNYTDLVAVTGGNFSAEGDSGSLIVTQSTADPVALLFAGSDSDTVGNAISDVLAAFSGSGNTTFVGGATHQVIGCTLPTKPQSAVAQQSVVGTETLQAAGMVRDARGPVLLGNSKIYAVGLGASYDHPGQAAIVLFLSPGAAQGAIPQSVDGVATRVIEGDGWPLRGLLSTPETAKLLQAVAEPQMVYTLRPGEMERAKVVHTAHAQELLKNSSVVGVGITSSVDSPGEAALLVYVKKGTAANVVPAVIDGLRTRVRETGPFVAGRGSGNGAAPSGCKLRSALNAAAEHGKL